MLNGMSLAARNAPFANAGLVAEIRLEDVNAGKDPLAALAFQASVEKAMFAAGDGADAKSPCSARRRFCSGSYFFEASEDFLYSRNLQRACSRAAARYGFRKTTRSPAGARTQI